MHEEHAGGNRALKKGVILLFCVAVVAYFLIQTNCPPRVPFEGLQQKALLYDDWLQLPKGDGHSIQAYQLAPLQVDRWVQNSSDLWLQGPLNDKRYLRAFEWAGGRWDCAKWLASDKFYFYLEDYEEFNDGRIHHSAIWALDAMNYRLYHISGCM